MKNNKGGKLMITMSILVFIIVLNQKRLNGEDRD